MRDHRRIQPTVDNLATLWYFYPDLRFGQIVDFVQVKARKEGLDLSNMEDDKVREFIKKLISEASGG